MKWLTLTEIKQQIRMEPDFTLEDDRLKGYAESAEDTILDLCRRSYDDFIDNYGSIPSPIREASLLLVSMSYQHREAVSAQNLYQIPYAFESRVKPYMRLTDGYTVPVQVVTLGSDVKIAFTVDLPDGLYLSDINFTGKVLNAMNSTKVMNFTKADCIPIDEGKEYVVLVDTATMGVGVYLLKIIVYIPDTDYQSGTRKEVVDINPHVTVRE